MRKRFTLLLLFTHLSFHWFAFGATLPSGFTEKRLASKLDPTGMAILPDGRLLVTIKSGRILLIKNDVVQTTPFLTLSNVDNWNERGVLCVVPDRAFATNPYIYVYYTYKNPTSNTSNNRVSRFTVNGDAATPSSELILINFNTLSTVGWHNGGGLVHGDDGKIYASTGENANGANAQNMSNLLGKIIRINTDGSIPVDNPFYNSASGQNRAIYALGLRNPFRMKLQPGTGKIYINDVGAGRAEEVNELKAGNNYGWPGIEGKRTTQTAPDRYQDPIFFYGHSGDACSITGGAFYSPTTAHFPTQYEGKYFFLDYCAGWIRYIDPANNYTVSNFATGVDRGLDMLVDPLGNMYYLARGGIGGGSDADNTSSNEGELWRVTYTGNGDVQITVHPQNRKIATGASVLFTVSASGTAPLVYQWKKDGIDIPGANSSSYNTPPATLTDNGSKFTVTVSNNSSSKTSDIATLTVANNTAPIVQITSPVEGTLYEAGSPIAFSGTATDAEDGSLPASSYSWTIQFHHDVHYHPGMDATSGITSGTYIVPDEGETSDTVWYRIILTATDAFGTKSTTFRDIQPKKVTITLNTEPVGLPLTLDGATITTPFTFQAVVGLKRSLEASNILTTGNQTLSFSKWSNHGSAIQTIKTPAINTQYMATYTTSKLDTLSVLADAYVRGGANAGTAYGSTDPTQLQTKTETTYDFTRHTYLRFDLTNYTTLLGAKLRLFGKRNSVENQNIMVGVYAVNNTTWDENFLTWGNKPTAAIDWLATSIVNAMPTSPGEYYEWDVSEYVRNEKQKGANAVSFLVANTEITSSYVVFNSKEANGNHPQLIITTDTALGIEAAIQTNEVYVFPNPTEDSFTIKSNGLFEYVLFDAVGLLIEKGNGIDLTTTHSPLTPGIYLARVKMGSSEKVIKLFKQ